MKTAMPQVEDAPEPPTPRRRYHGLFHQAANWVEAGPPLFLVLGISMLLHGLYDTMLKKDLHALALVFAVASFAWQVHRMTVSEANEREGSANAGWQTYRTPGRWGWHARPSRLA